MPLSLQQEKEEVAVAKAPSSSTQRDSTQKTPTQGASSSKHTTPLQKKLVLPGSKVVSANPPKELISEKILGSDMIKDWQEFEKLPSQSPKQSTNCDQSD